MNPTPDNAAAAHPLHPLLARMVAATGGQLLDADAFAAWTESDPGLALAVFAEDPARFKETLDIAVIVPELHAAAGGCFRVALLTPAASRALAPAYGVLRWPSLLVLRGGRYVGAVEGLRDWQTYVDELKHLFAAAPTRVPGVGIPLRSATPAPGCS